MSATNTDLYVIGLTRLAGYPERIDVDSKHLELTRLGVVLTGGWREVSVYGSQDYQVGRCIIPWARVLEIRSTEESTKAFGEGFEQPSRNARTPTGPSGVDVAQGPA